MSIIEGRWTPDVVTALCQQLYALARREEEAAAHLAARTPYWAAPRRRSRRTGRRPGCCGPMPTGSSSSPVPGASRSEEVSPVLIESSAVDRVVLACESAKCDGRAGRARLRDGGVLGDARLRHAGHPDVLPAVQAGDDPPAMGRTGPSAIARLRLLHDDSGFCSYCTC